MWKTARLAPILILAAALTSCGDSASPERITPRDLSPAEQQVVQAYNAFGFKLFHEVVANSEGGSVFISPVSVSMALGMTLNGASGTTEQAMRSTLEFDGLTAAQINQCYKSLIELLTGLDPTVQMLVGNSIWYRLGWTFEQSFLDTCHSYFGAEIAGLDFEDPGAAGTINDWVSRSTSGRITEIVSNPIDPYTVMFLINAIYFKGSWTYKFDPALTKDDVFHSADGSTPPCKMMQQPEADKELEFSYYGCDRFQMVDLPYGDGWFSMTLLLPAPSVQIDDLAAELSPETWQQWTGALHQQPGRIEMPRFELSYEQLLNGVLSTMGMGVAFDPYAADFTRMFADGGLYISRVKHKTFVKVDEEGTEAAAVTSVEVGATSAPDTFEMRLDRPFLFAIREKHSGTILFIGKIASL